MRSPLSVAVFLILLLAAAPASSDPLDTLFANTTRPIATFEATDEGALIRWELPPLPTFEGVTRLPESYHVYRHVVAEGEPMDALNAEYLDKVDYHEGPQQYFYVDTSYGPSVLTVYYVRPVLDGQQGPPSNPVGDYPPCNWLWLSLDPPGADPHPECLMPET